MKMFQDVHILVRSNLDTTVRTSTSIYRTHREVQVNRSSFETIPLKGVSVITSLVLTCSSFSYSSDVRCNEIGVYIDDSTVYINAIAHPSVVGRKSIVSVKRVDA